jgi:hypothetical protein
MASLLRTNWLARHLMTTAVVPTERAVARHKLVTNAAISDLTEVRTPRLFSVFADRPEMIPAWLGSLPSQFVVKSAVSSVGRHVCVLRRRGAAYVEPDGFSWPLLQLGLRVGRMPRPIFAEQIVEPHPQLASFATHGTLCDLRLHFVGDALIVGRCRVPTPRSRGYGNVGRGALGICVHPDGTLDVDHAYARAHLPREHEGRRLHGIKLVHWDEIVAEAWKVAALFSSAHVGVDGTIGPDGRLTVIEVTLVPDTKWLSPRGILAFRDAFRRGSSRVGCVESWLKGRPDLWRWVESRVSIEQWVEEAQPAWTDEVGLS